LLIPAASVSIERLFNIAKNICLYRRYNLKLNIIKVLIIFIYINHYILYENLQIIKASNNIKEEALLKEINNNKLKEIEIHRLINNNEKEPGMNFKEENDLPLLPRQGKADQPLGIAERRARLDKITAQKEFRR